MAKKKAAKKGGLMGILASVVLLAFSIVTIICLSAPLLQVSYDGEVATDETHTAFAFMDQLNEADSDGVKAIEHAKKSDAKLKEALDKAEAELKKIDEDSVLYNPAKKTFEAAKEAYNMNHNPIVIYDTILAVEVLAAVAAVAAVLALVMYALKKGNIGFIFNLVAFVLILGAFIAACIMMASANALADLGTISDIKMVTKAIAPAAVLAMSLIGSLVGGAFTFIAKKK